MARAFSRQSVKLWSVYVLCRNVFLILSICAKVPLFVGRLASTVCHTFLLLKNVTQNNRSLDLLRTNRVTQHVQPVSLIVCAFWCINTVYYCHCCVV